MKKLALILMFVVAFLSPAVALAAKIGDPCKSQGSTTGNMVCTNCDNSGSNCSWQTDPCSDTTVPGKSDVVDPKRLKNCVTQSPVVQDIQSIVNFLSVGVGIIVIIMIIVGGIQYSLAGDNSEATGKAKTRITNALIALFAYLFIFAFLQWIIPGGIFG